MDYNLYVIFNLPNSVFADRYSNIRNKVNEVNVIDQRQQSILIFHGPFSNTFTYILSFKTEMNNFRSTYS